MQATGQTNRKVSVATAVATTLLVLCSMTSRVAAQACCASPSVLTPARLGITEDILVGLLLTTRYAVGSFDSARQFVPSPANVREASLEGRVVAAFRLVQPVQVSIALPYVQGFRQVVGSQSSAGFFGDIAFGSRVELTRASSFLPSLGIAIIGTATLPTGRAPESARDVLGADVTGVGASTAGAAVAVEYARQRWLTNLTLGLSARFPRHVDGVRDTQAVRTVVAWAGSYLHRFWSIGAVVSLELEGKATRDDKTLDATARALWLVGLSAGLDLTRPNVRLIAATTFAPPISNISKNQSSTLAVTLGVLAPL